MRLRASVGHALGHRRRLVPDDVLPQQPAVGLEGQGKPPRNSEQLLAEPVCVADVDPEIAVAAKDSRGFVEHCDEPLDELAATGLAADLPVVAVVPLVEVRRRRHDALHTLVSHLAEMLDRVSVDDRVHRIRSLL